jgi:hypothetical protein
MAKLINYDAISNFGFPFKKYHLTEDYIKSCFGELCQYTGKITPAKYKLLDHENCGFGHDCSQNKIQYVIFTQPEEYEAYDILSDYFQEEQRLKARRAGNKESMLQLWPKIKANAAAAAKNEFGHINAYTLREAAYMLYGKRYECTSFRPTLITIFIKYFNARRILDMSAGWGDRLIGAMACDIDCYLGCDPNIKLQAGYNSMISLFEACPNKFQVLPVGFEHAELPAEPFDMMFSSPPFYNFEEYVRHKSQSINKRSYAQWLEEFLFPSMIKALAHLKGGGHIVLSISNVPKYKIATDLINFMSDKANFLGVIPYTSSTNKKVVKSPMPIWIWQKFCSN